MGTGNPLGRRMQGGYEKITIFDQYLVLSRKCYKIGLQLLWNSNASCRMMLCPMTDSDI